MNQPVPDLIYHVGGEESLEVVRLLWEKLRAHHAGLPWKFADDAARFTFELRRREIIDKAAGKLRVEWVSMGPEGAAMAYCISTVSADGGGEVDSIFVDEPQRGQGIGGELLRRSLAWLETMGATSKMVSVAYGNEEALALYRRFGFHPRSIRLQQRD